MQLAPPIDLLVAGPPCQGHSNLNNYSRRDDPRNDLFICTVAVAAALTPRAVLIENVPSITRSHGDVVGLARELLEGAGYLVDECVIRADELGWPQTRARYFLAGIRSSETKAKSVAGVLASYAKSNRREVLPVTWAIGDLQGLSDPIEPFDSSPVQTPENKRRIEWLFENESYDLVNSERPDCHKNGTTYTAVYGRMRADRPAPTITTGIGTPGQGRFIHPRLPRLITPHEAARIQGFPDWFKFTPPKGAAKRKDLAKWIGDAVPSVLGFTAASAVLSVLEQGTLYEEAAEAS
jgi:DNA (cytosine-5)-methyltransferase 1